MAHSENNYLSGSYLKIIERPGGSISGMKFSPGYYLNPDEYSCSSLAISYADHSVRIIPVGGKNAEKEVILRPSIVCPEHCEDTPTCISWNDDGDRLATGSVDGIVRICDRKGHVQKYNAHSGPITILLWHSNIIFSSSANGSTIMTNMEGGLKIEFPSVISPVTMAEWIDDCSLVAVTKDSCILLLDASSNQPKRKFVGHNGTINDLQFDPKSKFFATCADDKCILIWKTVAEEPHIKLDQKVDIQSLSWSSQHGRSGAIHLLAAALADNSVCIWDIDKKVKKIVIDHGFPVTLILFSPKSDFFLATACKNGMNLKFLHEFVHSGGEITSLCWTKNSNILASGTTDGKVILVDLSAVRCKQI